MANKKTKSSIRDQVSILKVLASEPRLEIVRLLCEHPQCVNAIVTRLKMTQPAISQHLRMLREIGLIRAEKRGTWIHYAICPETLKRCGAALSDVFGGWVSLPESVDGRKGCPVALLQECQPKPSENLTGKRSRS